MSGAKIGTRTLVIDMKRLPDWNSVFSALMVQIDVVLPVYNPASGWETTVINRFTSLQNRLPTLHFLLTIVNDGTTDLDNSSALQMIQTHFANFTWISYPHNQGKGYAIRKGVEQTKGEILVYTDIDWPYEEDSIVRMITLLQQEADIVIGIRDEHYYAKLPPMRRKISMWLRRINATFLRLKVSDTQAGLKGFKSSVKSDFLTTTINRYLFDLEFIHLISRSSQWNIVSLPIQLREGIQFRSMNRKILAQELWNFLKIWLKTK